MKKNCLIVLRNGLVPLIMMVSTNQGGKKMLNKKIAIVTGGGSGMGQSVALELARNGAEVFILGRTEEKLINTLRLAEMEKVSLHYKVCDVSNMEEVTLFFNELTIKGRFAQILLLIALESLI